DVIEIEIASVEDLTAVLTGVLVTLKNVVTSKFYLFLRKPVEHQQHNHTRDTNLERNGRDHLVVGRVGGQVAPAFEIMRQKIVCLVGRNNVSVTGVDERKSTTGRADVHRLPQAVEHQHLTV